jgi:anti-sigma regulatory factor (Ser/Thr protein kinase)
MRRGTSPNWAVSRTFPPDPSTVAIARSFALDALGGRPVDTDVVASVVSELVANAVQHARTPYTVHLEVDDPLLRIGVSDGSDVHPTRLSPPATQEHGRGLALIEGLSRTWGVTNQSRGKVVWLEMPLGNRA